jgi:hypothetical protein
MLLYFKFETRSAGALSLSLMYESSESQRHYLKNVSHKLANLFGNILWMVNNLRLFPESYFM